MCPPPESLAGAVELGVVMSTPVGQTRPVLPPAHLLGKLGRLSTSSRLHRSA